MLCQEGGQLPGCVQTGYAIRAFSRRAGWRLSGLNTAGFQQATICSRSIHKLCDGDSLRVRARGTRGGSEPGAVYRPSALRENGDSRARDPGQHAGDTVLRQHRLQAGSAHLGIGALPGRVVGSPRSRPKPQSPRQPIYLSVKRKASDQPESDQPESEPEKPEPEVTTFLLPRADGPQDEDFMRKPIFHSSNHVLVPCEFRHTGPGVSEGTECLYRVGGDKYQGKGCAWIYALSGNGDLSLLRGHSRRLLYGLRCATLHLLRALPRLVQESSGRPMICGGGCGCGPGRGITFRRTYSAAFWGSWERKACAAASPAAPAPTRSAAACAPSAALRKRPAMEGGP